MRRMWLVSMGFWVSRNLGVGCSLLVGDADFCVGLVKTAAKEVGGRNIRVNAVTP